MKRQNCSGSLRAVVFAALTIIGCSVSALICCEKRRAYHRRTLDEAVQNWEGEGGAVVVEQEEEAV